MGEEVSTGLKQSEEEPSNVWASIRKIKESSQNYEALFSSKSDPNVETVSINDIDDMIQQLAQQIANKRIQPCEDSKLDKPSLNKIEEETEELKTNTDSELNHKEDVELKENKQSNRNSLINTADSNSLKQPFDYEQWKTAMDKMFGEKSEEVLKRSASDEMYLKSLKDKIQQNVKKTK